MADPALVDYIRRNRSVYTEAALREQLISEGHSPSAVDAALVEAGKSASVRRPGGWSDSFSTGGFWLGMVGSIVALVGLVYVVSLALPGLGPVPLWPLVGVALLVALILAIAGPFDVHVRRGIGCGVALVVGLPIIVLAGLYAYCLLNPPNWP